MKFSLRFQKDEVKGASDRTSWMERTGGSQCIFTPVCILWMMSTLAVVCLRIALYFRELLFYYWSAFLFKRIQLVVGQLPVYHWSTRSQSCEKLLLASSCLSVCSSAWDISVPTWPILMKFGIWIFVENIIYLFTAIGLLPGGSGYFTCKRNMKLVTTRFKSGGLHEKHGNLGNHLSICL